MMTNPNMNQSITSPKEHPGVARLSMIQLRPMMVSPLSDPSPLSSDYSSSTSTSTSSSTSSIARRHQRLNCMISNDKASKERGSCSSLSSDKSTGSREDESSPGAPSSPSVTPMTSRRSCRRGSLYHCLQKSRLAAAPGGALPTLTPPPFGAGKAILSRSSRQQLHDSQNQQETHKCSTPPDKKKLSVNSLLKSTSFSSMSSLIPLAPSLSSSCSSSSNWGSSSSFRNEIMTMNIAQRSSSKEVKAILTLLAEATDETACEEVVEVQCAMIARMALDAYYQVVISKYGGARILCHVVKHFLHNASILESCFSTLQRMPHAPHLQQYSTIELLMAAMDCHPDSIHVQSATCQTLAAILTTTTTAAAAPMDCDYSRLSDLVDRAAHMFLTPAGLKSVRTLRTFLLERKQQEQESSQLHLEQDQL